ncbi:MAG: dephospho-CoA kinase [Saprospiraceae bacterium]|nr:dephospho-CoA kinase [Saprospiraceae bacterium]
MVGITGGMGAGKSLVARIFSVLNIPIYDSDTRAKKLMTQSPKLVQSIKELLGDEAYLGDQLNRKLVASKIFTDDFLLEALNHLVHPAVHADAANWHSTFPSAPYTLREAALLYESGAYLELDYVIVVSAPEPIRIKRIAARDGISNEEIKSRIDRQWTEQQRGMLADFVIVNDGQHSLIPQVMNIHKQLLDIQAEDHHS